MPVKPDLLVAWLFPANMEEGLADPAQVADQTTRIRALVAAFLCTIIANLPLTYLLYAVAVSGFDKHIVLVSSATTMLFTVIGWLILRFGRSIIVASHWYALTFLVGLSLPAMITGGLWNSPYIELIVIVPVWSFLMLGRIPGIIWTSLTLLILLIFFIAENSGLVFPQVIPDIFLSISRLGALILSLTLVVVCIYWYDFSIENLQVVLRQERKSGDYNSYHDELTGLLNRYVFYRRINVALDFAAEEGMRSAILCLDLNNFNRINEEYGREAGDEVLRVVAQRLKAVVRTVDTVARLDSNEFGLVLHGITREENITIVREKITVALRQPISVRDSYCQVDASIGCVVTPDQGTQLESLLRQAQQAMREEKSVLRQL